VTGKVKVVNALPIITIPTVAATGSEMDCGGVISNVNLKEKRALVSPLLQPEVSFLNPENTYSVSAFQTACGCADILSHVFDCYYFTSQPKLAMVDGVMENLIKTVIKYAPVAIEHPCDCEARSNLLWSSSWALNGFLETGIEQAPACHLMEHELSAYYDITHGLGLAIITPKWLKYILDNNTAPQIKKFGVDIFGIDESLTDIEGANVAIDKLSCFLYGTLGLASNLTEIGIDDKNFSEMAQKACGGGVINSFKNLNSKDVENIYRMCL
jgi:hypothetical protein